MAPRSSGRSRPWRPLAALAVIIVVMLVSVTATGTFHPGRWQQQFKVALGLDLAGGTEMLLQAQAPQGHQPSAAEMGQAASILLSRVNATGTTGAQVQQQGSDMLDVSAPGASANLLNQVKRHRPDAVPPGPAVGAARREGHPGRRGDALRRRQPGQRGHHEAVQRAQVHPGHGRQRQRRLEGHGRLHAASRPSGTTRAARSSPATPAAPSTCWTRRCSRAPT